MYDIGYIDFHQHMYKKKRKSIYSRKYHIEDLLFYESYWEDLYASIGDVSQKIIKK